MYSNENELVFADKVYIDTSTLMDVPALKMFIKNYRDILNKSKTVIIVPAPVTQELVRHLSNGEKHEMARQALNLIRTNNDVFQMEPAEFSYDEVKKAFADETLYKILLSQRGSCRQLLITNDKKLSRDAFKLNNLESWTGRTVAVCYVTARGLLNPCECVTEQYTQNNHSFDTTSSSEKTASEKHPDPIGTDAMTLWKYIFEAAAAVGLFAVGIFAGKLNSTNRR